MTNIGTKKNANTRKLIISNYRNIGITFGKEDKPAELVLNRGLKPDELGDLLLLVGPNNSGKSNALAALEAFGSGTVGNDDFPDFMYWDQLPDLVMKITNDNIEKSRKLLSKVDKKSLQKTDLKAELEALKSDLEKILKEGIKLKLEREVTSKEISKAKLSDNEKGILTSYGFDSKSLSELKREFTNNTQSNTYHYYQDVKLALEKKINELETKDKLTDIENNIKKNSSREEVLKKDIGKKTEELEASSFHYVANGNEMPEYDYLLSPKIVTYKQVPITQNNLSCKPNEPSDFMKNILMIMGINASNLDNIYSQYVAKRQKSYLKKFADDLNKDVPKIITDRFNKMYYCKDGEEYRFEFDLDADRVYVSLYRGDVPIDLDKQSTGFKWFFDFFFNFVYKEELKPGDIIIMDEPATNLHVSGQIELRDFLKETAMKNGLTFVISTHSPFMVNCDYLDELRLMVRDKRGFVKIADKFDIVSESADKLDPVLNGLTIGRHILVGPKQKVIFTEGITDYDYLTSFKLLFARENNEYKRLTFLPVGGVKNDKLLSILTEINSSPILLVDSDGPGKDIQKGSDGTGVNVLSLAEVDGEKGQYKTIETLFTVEDRERFALYEKDWNCASMFKRNIFENEKTISDTTKNRFRKVLDWLLDV